MYWINSYAWNLRGLVVNEYDSGKYDDPAADGSGNTKGESILIRFGFTDSDDNPYTYEWAWYAVAFTTGFAILSMFASTMALRYVRHATGASLVTDKGDDYVEEVDPADMVSIPFMKVDMTFKNIHYTVTASTSNEKLELLKGIDGIIASGKMTALMGSSGAGKTTLMVRNHEIGILLVSYRCLTYPFVLGRPCDEKELRGDRG